jgi:hypothetical protein
VRMFYIPDAPAGPQPGAAGNDPRGDSQPCTAPQ